MPDVGNDDKLEFAGDIRLDSVIITTPNGFSQNIMKQVAAVTIYESIHKNFIEGTLVIKESLDFANLFPLTGQETVTIRARTPGLPEYAELNATFFVYKMTDREVLGDRSIVYELHFISIEAIAALNKKVSRAYEGNIGDIVREILTNKDEGLETEKGIFIEPVENQHKFIANFWDPVQSINYLKQRALNKDNAPYIFYENRDGFIFASLESHYDSGEPQHLFTKDNYTRDEAGDGTDYLNPQEDYKRIQDISIEVGYDYISRLKSGFYGSRQISFDLYSKKYTMKDFDYYSEFTNNKVKSLNTHQPFPSTGTNRPVSAQMTFMKISNIYDSFILYDGDTTNYATIQKHKSLRKMAEANVLTITVPGRMDYTAGMKVEVRLPLISPLKESDTDIYDKRWSGYYIVASINHFMNKQGHECTMELISDSLQMSADDTSEGAREGFTEVNEEAAARSGIQ